MQTSTFPIISDLGSYPLLQRYRSSEKSPFIPSLWTNNIIERVNNALKQLVDWKTTSLLQAAKLVT